MNDDLKNIGMHGGASPQIFSRAKALRRRLTEAEKKLWEFLKHKPLGFKFRRQHPFDLYILDFFCLQARLSIEIDGESHARKFQKIQDMFRTQVLNEYNIKELRFDNSDILEGFEHVKVQILEILNSRIIALKL